MKILVTGGNGFVGKFIVNHLSQNHIIFNPRSSELDLKNLNQVNQWFDQNHVDAVVHCALTGREELFSENPQYLSDGLLMFRNLWLNRHKFNRFINLGTAYEFDLSKYNVIAEASNIFIGFEFIGNDGLINNVSVLLFSSLPKTTLISESFSRTIEYLHWIPFEYAKISSKIIINKIVN